MRAAKIFFNELLKLLHNKAFILVLIIAVCLNAYVSMENDNGYMYADSAYRAYMADVEGMSLDEAAQFTQDAITEAYSTAEGRYTEYYFLDTIMLSAQLEKIQQIQGYQDYLASIDSQAQTMTSVSIFADKDSFSYRNIVKTPPVYEAVKDVEPVFAPSDGVLLACDNVVADILALFVLIFCVTAVFYKDRESGITALIKPLKYGRSTLALSKIALVFVVCLVVELVMFFSNLAIGSMRYGLGDLSRPVQSLAGYIGCNHPISVLEMMIYSLLIKLFAMLMCAVIASCLFIRLSNTVSYLVIIAIAAVQTSLYILIPSTSILSPLKQINLATFLLSSRLFKTYTNINFFGYPVEQIATTIVSMLIATVAFVLLCCRLYSTISISEVKRNRRIVLIKRVPTSLISYTAFKEFIMHKGALILAAVLALQVYTAIDYTKPYMPDDNVYYAYCTRIIEMTDEEADEFVASEEKRFADILQLMSIGAATTEQSEEYRASYGGFEKARQQYESIKSLGYGAKDMYYQTGYKDIFGVSNPANDYSLGLIAIIALCLMLSPLIAYDNRCRIGYVIYTTRAGKKTYLKHNCIIAIICAILASVFTYIPYFAQILSAYGTAGIGSSIRCIAEFSGFIYIPVAVYLVLMFILRTVVLMLFALLLLFISSKCQSPTTSIVVTLAIFCLPIVIYLAGANAVQYLCVPISINREFLWLSAS